MQFPDNDILLDVTRTVSRAGAGSTSGVDRVERAYIRAVLAHPGRVFFLSRALGGAVLLDRDGMAAFLRHVDGELPLDPPDMISRLGRRQPIGVRQAESTLRRLGCGMTRSARIAKLIGRNLSPRFTFLTVGHTHQTEQVLGAVRAAGAGRIATLIHDVIPLDYPEYTRPTAVARFERQLRCVCAASDLLICNSEYTARRTRHWLSVWGAPATTVTALLGTDPLPVSPTSRRSGPPRHPAFVTLGTIEPRKNHLLLLSIWRRFHDTLPPERTPHLHIVGRRGWENENIVDILDRAPFMGQTVFEHGFLPDTDLGALLGDARALLFPSFVEGFGYPLVEAIQLGKPAICADLAPFREIGGDTPFYLDPLDGPGWMDRILSLAWQGQRPDDHEVAPPVLPTWDGHFMLVGNALTALSRT